MLKDYLSPDIWREYGPRETEQQREGATANGQGEEAHETRKNTDGTDDVPVTPCAQDEQQ